MADKKISQLTAAAALTGSEPIPAVQGGVTVQTTAQEIADLYKVPNIIVPITEDYELSADDVNKLLYVTAPDVTLTMPDPFPFAPLDKVFIFPNENTKLSPLNGFLLELPNITGGSNPFITCYSTGAILTPDLGFINIGSRQLEYSKYLGENVTNAIEVNSGVTNAVPYGLVDAEVPLDSAIGGSATVTTIIKDGSNVQVITDNITYSAINVGGTITGDVDVATTSSTLSSGTLTTAYSIIQNPVDTDRVTILITPTSSLTPTLIEIKAKFINATNSKL